MEENAEKKVTIRAPVAPPLLFSCRLTLFIVCLFATLNFMLQRLNINFAIVCMVKHGPKNISIYANTSSSVTENYLENFLENNGSLPINVTEIIDLDEDVVCGVDPNSKGKGSALAQFGEGEFDWSKDLQAAVIGSFYYGYILSQVIGGWLSDRFGGKKLFVSSIIFFSILNILNPIAARVGPRFLFAARFLMGLSHGASLPAISVFAARWTGHTERSVLLGIAFAGFTISMAIIFPMSAFICQYFGWAWIFYITGGFGVMWCIVAWFLIYDWPEKHPRISPEELKFLQENRSASYGSRQKKLSVPWRKILTSRAINVIHFTHLCACFGFFLMISYLPTFLSEVVHLSVTKNGLLSSLPYIGMVFLHFFVGVLFDSLRKKNLCSVTNLRKIFNTIGLLGQGFCLLFVGFITCQGAVWGMVLVALGQSLVEFAMMGGYLFSIFEIAPRYAGILTGITGIFGILSGFLAPIVVGFLTPNGTRQEWLSVFYIGGAINFIGGLVYIFLGTSELQPWASSHRPSLAPTNGIGNEGLLNDTNITTNGNTIHEAEMEDMTTAQKLLKYNDSDEPNGNTVKNGDTVNDKPTKTLLEF